MANAGDASLVVRGLNVAYGESKVLFDVDFQVADRKSTRLNSSHT